MGAAGASPRLTAEERALLQGRDGDAGALAMKLLVRMAEIAGAERLLEISSAHIDGCLYHGDAGLDFARRLVDGGAQVRVPATLNVSSLDLLHPDLFRGDSRTAGAARELMELYVAMGCTPTWTCAPYHLPARPRRGEHVAWAESNAIVFANSVLGARTERYGDFMDICAALTGRVPDAGLHRDENRRADIVFRLHGVPRRLLRTNAFFPVLGHFIGMRAGSSVPVIEGLPGDIAEDRLKALGAAAASSGSVALFHAVGVTPEARTLAAALRGSPPAEVVDVTGEDIRRARDSLSTATSGELAAVSLGTPHYSIDELDQLVRLLKGAHVAPGIDLYVSTSRQVLAEAEARGWVALLEAAGVQPVVDTCTYVTPILQRRDGIVMSDSAKWAYYAPGNLGVDVVFGSTKECVASAITGRVWRDEELWSGL